MLGEYTESKNIYVMRKERYFDMKLVIKPYMEPIIDFYYKNNAVNLHNTVNKILIKIHYSNDNNKDDFYSLADEVFVLALLNHEELQSFDKFLYSCLYKKICTEITNRTRDKRCTKVKVKEMGEDGKFMEKILIIPDESLDAPVHGDESYTLGEVIADHHTIERELFEKDEIYSEKMLLYLERLSNLQREVLKLNIAGYLPNEIKKELHISEKQYADCYAAIHSYKNVSVLF